MTQEILRILPLWRKWHRKNSEICFKILWGSTLIWIPKWYSGSQKTKYQTRILPFCPTIWIVFEKYRIILHTLRIRRCVDYKQAPPVQAARSRVDQLKGDIQHLGAALQVRESSEQHENILSCTIILYSIGQHITTLLSSILLYYCAVNSNIP